MTNHKLVTIQVNVKFLWKSISLRPVPAIWRSAPSSPSCGWYPGLRHHRHGSTHGTAGSHGNLVGLNISFDPNTERRLWGLHKKMCVSQHDSSSSICQSVSMVPEPVGHSTRNPTLCQRASNPRAPCPIDARRDTVPNDTTAGGEPLPRPADAAPHRS